MLSACGADADGDSWNGAQTMVGADGGGVPVTGPSGSGGALGSTPAQPPDPAAPQPSSSELPSTGASQGPLPSTPATGPAPTTSGAPSDSVEPPTPVAPDMPGPVNPDMPMPPFGTMEPDAGAAPPETDPEPPNPGQDTDAGTTEAPDGDDDNTEDENVPTTTDSEQVPMTDHCAAVSDWDPMWAQWEDEVLLLVNEYRAMGFNCDSQGSFGATTPLASDPILRCAARLHSLDMYERGYFDHDNPDGLDPFERMQAAGFSGSYMGENIAQGQASPQDVMEAWMDSDGHCSNVMSPDYTLIGVGYHPGSDSNRRAQRYWTQNFGTPPRQGGGFGR